MDKMLRVTHASTLEDYQAAKKLMLEYRDKALGEDYAIAGCGLNEELANFPAPYIPPFGLILLAKSNDIPCACLALRPISKMDGEVMRMYVQPEFRGKKIAEKLLQEIIISAKNIGYKRLYLDSLHKFKNAHKIYEKFGFSYCAPYSDYINQKMINNMVFMRLDL